MGKVGLKTRIKELKKLGCDTIKVRISTVEKLLKKAKKNEDKMSNPNTAEEILSREANEYADNLKSMPEFEHVSSGFITAIYKAGARKHTAQTLDRLRGEVMSGKFINKVAEQIESTDGFEPKQYAGMAQNNILKLIEEVSDE